MDNGTLILIGSISIGVVTFICVPMIVFFLQRWFRKRDATIEALNTQKESGLNIKLDAVVSSNKEMRDEFRLGIGEINKKLDDFRFHNENSHKELWIESNGIRERVSALEAIAKMSKNE